MNRKLDIKKHAYVLFAINLLVLLTLFLFKTYYTYKGYHVILINAMVIVNIMIFILGICFNVEFVKNPNRFNENKSIKTIIICFIIYLLLNTLGIYIINKPLDAGYTNISSVLVSYCDSFECERYETVKVGNYEDFIIKKGYFDYNNVQNDIEIHTKYSSNEIILVKAIIYSEKDLFSETLIKEQLESYFDHFNVKLSEEKIKMAFDKRFEDKVLYENMSYRVTEVYNKGQLEKLKTVIILKLNKD